MHVKTRDVKLWHDFSLFSIKWWLESQHESMIICSADIIQYEAVWRDLTDTLSVCSVSPPRLHFHHVPLSNETHVLRCERQQNLLDFELIPVFLHKDSAAVSQKEDRLLHHPTGNLTVLYRLQVNVRNAWNSSDWSRLVHCGWAFGLVEG